LKVICSWHKGEMGEKEPFSDSSITHGICADCLKKMQKEVDQYYSQHDLKKEIEK